jgi:hypothetical protein
MVGCVDDVGEWVRAANEKEERRSTVAYLIYLEI